MQTTRTTKTTNAPQRKIKFYYLFYFLSADRNTESTDTISSLSLVRHTEAMSPDRFRGCLCSLRARCLRETSAQRHVRAQARVVGIVVCLLVK
jgi:hypothetical protein